MDQSLRCGANRRHRRGARRVANVVRAVKVVDIRNPAGNAIGQFAGHAVFGNRGQMLADPLAQFASDVAAQRFRQCGEAGAFGQLVRILRKKHAQRGEIVLFPAQGIAQDHGGPVQVQRTLGVTVVFQRFAGAGDRPFLRPIHGVGHFGRDGQVPFHRVPRVVADPAADLGIGLVWRAVVGVEIQRRVPTVGIDFGDAVTAVLHVFPESRDVRCIGQDSSRPYNRYGSV